MSQDALRKNGVELVEVDVQSFFKDLMVASVAAFLKNESFEQILKGEIPIKEKLFNAFDGFVMAFKVPRMVLKHMKEKKKNEREGIFIEGLVLHFEENANFVEKRIKDCY